MIDNEERMEAGYLQSKYPPITTDEVLDFAVKMTNDVTGADSFLRMPSAEQGTKVKFSTKCVPQDTKPRWHCSWCGCDFGVFGKMHGKDCCPQCGTRSFLWIRKLECD